MEEEKKQMGIVQFLIRLAIYCVFGGIIPFAFLTWRFKLFSKVTSTSIGGWGILAIAIGLIFILKLMRNLTKMLDTYPAQIVKGISRVIIPLIAAAVLSYCMRNMMVELFQFLCVLVFCELVAIIVNPFPQWEEQHHIEKDEKRFISLFKSLINKEK